MRILHTESSLGWGGQEIRVLLDAHDAALQGHDVTCCISAGSKFVERASFCDERVKFKVACIERKSFASLLSMMRVLRELKPDVVVTHSSTDSWLVTVASVLVSCHFRIVRVRHISTPVGRSIFSRWLYRKARAVITTSDEIAGLIRRIGGVGIVESIPTGVDVDVWQPPFTEQKIKARKQLGVPVDCLCVGMVSTLRSWKGHRYAIEALRHLPYAILVVVGDGPQEENLRRLALEYNVSNRIVFKGYTKDVVEVMHGFDVFLQPSTSNEGVSQAVLQALACALPCIVSDIGGLNEPIHKNTKSGLLISPHSVSAIVKAVDQIYSNTDLGRELGQTARSNVELNYSRSLSWNKFAGVLDAVAKN